MIRTLCLGMCGTRENSLIIGDDVRLINIIAGNVTRYDHGTMVKIN